MDHTSPADHTSSTDSASPTDFRSLAREFFQAACARPAPMSSRFDGVNRGVIATLSYLRARGDMTPSEISGCKGISTARVANILASLEKKGLVKRIQDTRDRRKIIVRITEAAALASARWLGRGAKESGDGAAVEAMRNSFTTLHIDGVVVIGEGEKDKAPMLYTGENVGMGDGPSLDVAVDPVEGTNLLAYGRPNAISVMGVAPRGSMFSLDRSFYMQKLVVGSEAKDVVDLDAPVDVNLERVAKALGKKVSDLVVFVLDKPRHAKLIEDIRKAGARITLATDGDVAGALMAADPRSEVDVMMGTGGTPEGVITACALKGLGGQILGRLDPQSYPEKEAIQNAGWDLREMLSTSDLVKSDDCFFAATGISGGDFLHGVRYCGRHAITHSMVLRGKTGTIRYVESFHDINRLRQLSAVAY